MYRDIKNLIYEFERIKRMGWIKSLNNNKNGVGLTFENLLGISSNELEIPDYDGIEIKTKRISSTSYITLFSCKPEGKYYHESERIKNEYGYPHKKFRQYKVLNNSVYGDKKNKIGIQFYFKLEVDRKSQKIYLLIYNLKGDLLEREVYWDFDVLKEKVERKLRVLAFIKAESKNINGNEYFKYISLFIYKLIGFEKFIELIETGVIRLNFKLNIKNKGEKIGQIHDHGTGFEILEKDILKLYDRIV